MTFTNFVIVTNLVVNTAQQGLSDNATQVWSFGLFAALFLGVFAIGLSHYK